MVMTAILMKLVNHSDDEGQEMADGATDYLTMFSVGERYIVHDHHHEDTSGIHRANDTSLSVTEDQQKLSAMDKVMGVKNSHSELLFAQTSRILDTERDRVAKRLQNEQGRLQQEFRVMKIDMKMNEIVDKKRDDPAADTALEENQIEQVFKFLKSDAENPCYLDTRQRFPIRVTIKGTEDNVTHGVAKARKKLADMELERQIERLQTRRSERSRRSRERRAGAQDILAIDSDESGSRGEEAEAEVREPPAKTFTSCVSSDDESRIDDSADSDSRKNVKNTDIDSKNEANHSTQPTAEKKNRGNKTKAQIKKNITGSESSLSSSGNSDKKNNTTETQRQSNEERILHHINDSKKSNIVGESAPKTNGIQTNSKAKQTNSVKIRQTSTSEDDMELGADYISSSVHHPKEVNLVDASHHHLKSSSQKYGNFLQPIDLNDDHTTHDEGWASSVGYITSSGEPEVMRTREMIIIKQRVQRRARELAMQAAEDNSTDGDSDDEPLSSQNLSKYEILLTANKAQINYNFNRVMTARPVLQNVSQGLPEIAMRKTSTDDSALPDKSTAQIRRESTNKRPSARKRYTKTIDGTKTNAGLAPPNSQIPRDYNQDSSENHNPFQKAANANGLTGTTIAGSESRADTKHHRCHASEFRRNRAITSIAVPRGVRDRQVAAQSEMRSKSVAAKPKRPRMKKQQTTMTQDDLKQERSQIEDRMSRFFGSLEEQRILEEQRRKRNEEFDIDAELSRAPTPPKNKAQNLQKRSSILRSPQTEKESQEGLTATDADSPPSLTDKVATFAEKLGERPGLVRRATSDLTNSSSLHLPTLDQRPVKGVPSHAARRSNRHSATFKLQKIMASMNKQSSTSQLMEVEKLRHKTEDSKPMEGIQEHEDK